MVGWAEAREQMQVSGKSKTPAPMTHTVHSRSEQDTQPAAAVAAGEDAEWLLRRELCSKGQRANRNLSDSSSWSFLFRLPFSFSFLAGGEM